VEELHQQIEYIAPEAAKHRYPRVSIQEITLDKSSDSLETIRMTEHPQFSETIHLDPLAIQTAGKN
jgi:hypothetical protein